MRRLLTLVSTTAVLAAALAAVAGGASAELREDCYDRLGYRSTVVCFKMPPGVDSPVELP